MALPLIDAAAAAGGDGKVVLIGGAQEKTPVWRSWPAKGQENKPHPHNGVGPADGVREPLLLLCVGPGLGSRVHQNAYATWPIWIYLNGHEWAKRQLEIAGLGYEALDNGFRSCDNPEALQRICDRVGLEPVRNFYWRWFNRLPSPVTTDDVKAGYGYELAFRQFEVSDTRFFDRPQAGRAFSRVLSTTTSTWAAPTSRPGLRPQGQLPHPGHLPQHGRHPRGRPAVVVLLQKLEVEAVLEENRALRTKTVICNTRDFGIGLRVNAENWHALVVGVI